MNTRKLLLSVGLGGIAAVLLTAPAIAASGADYFKGKTVTYIVSTGAGGGYDYYGRLISEYMERNLPGSTIIVKNVPGAGHIIGANQIYNAKPDGLTIGTFNTGLIYAQLIGRKGVKFDLTKMSWIGKAAADPRVFTASTQSNIKTLKELKTLKETKNVAVSGVGSASYNETKMLIEALNLNLKMIAGYRGNADMMAMRRGEVIGVIGSRSSFQQFVNNGYARFVFQIGGKDTDVPQLASLVTDKDAKSVIALIRSQAELSRFTAGPPGIPDDRLAALRAAYKKALDDPELRAQAKKAGRPIDPAFGEDVGRRVKAALDQSPKMVALVAKILEVKAAATKVKAAVIEVEDGGRFVIFKGPGGKKVKSKVSGSRTKITIAGKAAKRKKLKNGMTCNISYVPGGRNEPKTLDCK